MPLTRCDSSMGYSQSASLAAGSNVKVVFDTGVQLSAVSSPDVPTGVTVSDMTFSKPTVIEEQAFAAQVACATPGKAHPAIATVRAQKSRAQTIFRRDA